MAAHQCRACILYCMDFRLHEHLTNFFASQKLDVDGADVIRVAGAAKSLVSPKEDRDKDFLLEMLQIAYDLHGVRQFYLINHEDCGAYGLENVADSDQELDTHRQDLRAAVSVLQDRFPDAEVSSYLMWLSGEPERID